jgi:hypothetical protein
MRRLPIALALALAGCFPGAEEGSRVQASQVPQGLGRYRTVFVEVSTQDPQQYEGVETLKSALMGRLATLSCFDTFVTGVDPRSAELRISAVLIGAVGVSSTERVLFGGFADKPRVTVEVRLVDLGSGALVGRFKVEGTISGGTPTGYTTPEAFENAGAGIAEYINLHK